MDLFYPLSRTRPLNPDLRVSPKDASLSSQQHYIMAAMAVKEVFPSAPATIGPALEDGST